MVVVKLIEDLLIRRQMMRHPRGCVTESGACEKKVAVALLKAW